jgi:hypothetical protein
MPRCQQVPQERSQEDSERKGQADSWAGFGAGGIGSM